MLPHSEAMRNELTTSPPPELMSSNVHFSFHPLIHQFLCNPFISKSENVSVTDTDESVVDQVTDHLNISLPTRVHLRMYTSWFAISQYP